MQVNRDICWLGVRLVVTFAMIVASSAAKADSWIIYKCKNLAGKVLYSDLPCDKQDARKLKVLQVDEQRRNISESKYDPAENPANRELSRQEQRRFFIPVAEKTENLTYLRVEAAVQSAVSPTEPNNTLETSSDAWFSRALAWVKRLFGLSS